MTQAYPRILLLAQTLPWPAHPFGGAQRTALFVRALGQLAPVDLLLVSPPDYRWSDGRDPDQTRRDYNLVGEFTIPGPRAAGAWTPLSRLHTGPLSRLARQLAEMRGAYLTSPDAAAAVDQLLRSGRYGLVVSRYLKPATLCGLDRHRRVPTILDFDDIDYRLLEQMQHATPWTGWKGRVAAAISRRYLRRICLRAARGFDHVFLTSDADIAHCPLPGASVLPNVPFRAEGDIRAIPPAAGSQELLFVGHLGYAPNRDGVARFIERVWPAVRRAEPRTTLRLVGVGLEEPWRGRWSAVPGVIAEGFVADIAEVYARCAFTVSPVYWGAGTKIKVIESLAFGRSVVATPHALCGYEQVLRDGESVCVAQSDEAMAEACLTLLRDSRGRDTLAAHGAQVVARRYSRASFEREVIRVARQLLPASHPPGQRAEAPAQAQKLSP